MCCKAFTTNLLARNQKKGRLTLEQKAQTQRNISRKPCLNLKPYNFWNSDDLQALHNYKKKKKKKKKNLNVQWVFKLRTCVPFCIQFGPPKSLGPLGVVCLHCS